MFFEYGLPEQHWIMPAFYILVYRWFRSDSSPRKHRFRSWTSKQVKTQKKNIKKNFQISLFLKALSTV